MESYAQRETTPPLLEETIGANFEAAVARHPDREALVEVASGRRWTWGETVRAFATGKLAHYEIPRYVIVVDEFPMTVTGKVRKVEMRETSAVELGLRA